MERLEGQDFRAHCGMILDYLNHFMSFFFDAGFYFRNSSGARLRPYMRTARISPLKKSLGS